jgi:alkylation response protein AidB-like acyl-CoA dehydrogenase
MPTYFWKEFQERHVSNAETSATLSAIEERMRTFATTELADPPCVQGDADVFWREGWDRCGAAGIIGGPLPSEWGGSGRGLLSTIVTMETLGNCCADLGLLFSINAHLWAVAIPILTFGSDAQKKRWLPALADGRLIGGHGATEPDAGSDIFSMTSTAVRDGDQWVLQGHKNFVANGPISDVFVVYATTAPERGELGVTAFIVERDNPGLTIGEPLEKVGLQSSPSGTITMKDCRIPLDDILGSEGGGAACFNCSMEWERGSILAMHVGSMERQLNEAIAHVRSRRQFNRAIGSFQSVANRIVDMKVRLDTARPLVRRIGELKDAGRGAMLESAVAKLHVSEAAVASGLDAMQIHGSRGYLSRNRIDVELRDALGARIYSGTNDLQRVMIARLLGLPSSLVGGD